MVDLGILSTIDIYTIEIVNGILGLLLLIMLVIILRQLKSGILYRSILPSLAGVVVFALASLLAPFYGQSYEPYFKMANTLVFLLFFIGAFVLYRNLRQLT